MCVFSFFEKNSKAMSEQAIYGTPNPTDKRSKKKKKKLEAYNLKAMSVILYTWNCKSSDDTTFGVLNKLD